MRFERLMSAEADIFPRAMELYRGSFPFHEQREPDSQARIMAHPEYQFNLIYDRETFAGLLLCWETADFIYVEHFCILPCLRGQKYGQRALELLAHRGKTVILEIDPPVDEISIRRKGFYERLDYRANPYPHCHPAYHAGYPAHDLVVMSCPGLLSQAQYGRFFHYLTNTVMRI